MLNQIIEEIRIHRQLSDTRDLTKLFKVFESTQNIYILLEYHNKETLEELRGCVTEIEARRLIVHILVALEFMHSCKSVLHRDIKL